MMLEDAYGNTTLYQGGLAGLAAALADETSHRQMPLVVYANHFSKDFPLFHGGEPHSMQFPSSSVVNTSLFGASGSLPIGFYSEQFYTQLFAEWTKVGMQAYEVDFLEKFVYETPGFAESPRGAAVWLDGLAAAAAASNISVQICTATAFDAMQALLYPAVTNVRASPDYRDYPNHYVGHGFLIAWALGLAPSKDVFWTTANQPTHDDYPTCAKGRNRSNAELDVVLAAFSTGPVGIGDAVGYTNVTRARALARADGLLLPPSKPWTPVEFTLWQDGRQLLQFAECAANSVLPRHTVNCTCVPQLLQSFSKIPSTTMIVNSSKIAGGRAQGSSAHYHYHYLLAVAVTSYQLQPEDFWPRLPAPPPVRSAPTEDAALVDGVAALSPLMEVRGGRIGGYFLIQRSGLEHSCSHGLDAVSSGCAIRCPSLVPERSGNAFDSDEVCSPVVSSRVGYIDPTQHKLGWQFTMLAPVTASGWAFIGELGKYNPMSPNRVISVRTEPAKPAVKGEHGWGGSSSSDGQILVAVAGSLGEPISLTFVSPEGRVVVTNVTVGPTGEVTIVCSRAHCAAS
jgi:hypothetical protein